MKTKKLSKKHKVIIALLGIAIAGVLLFDIFLVGNIPYLGKWSECGARPVVVSEFSNGLGFGAQPVEVVATAYPGIMDGKISSLFSYTTMYCSIDEAKQHYGDKLKIR